MKKAIAILSTVLVISLAFNGVLLFQRHSDEGKLQNYRASATTPVTLVLAQCEQYAQWLSGSGEPGASFLYPAATEMNAACNAVSELLGESGGDDIFSKAAPQTASLSGVFRALNEAFNLLANDESAGNTKRRELCQKACGQLGELFNQALKECNSPAQIDASNAAAIYRAMKPHLEAALAPGGELFAVIDELVRL